MEVRPGYKQTEVGVIPEAWDCVAVQTLVDENILEKPLDGNHGNIHPKSSDFVDYGIPFVMANNFLDGQVDLLGCKFITKERAAKLQKGFSIAGDVLLTHKGTVGNTAIVPELNVDFIMLTPQVTYYRLRDENRLNNGFLRQYFDSQPFQSLFKSLAGGGTRAYLGIVKQLALPIIKPPIDEQRAIAKALSDVDVLLGGLDRLIAKKRDLKQATMQQLLTGQTRLPGFHGEWEVVKAADVGRFQGGSGFPIKFQGATSGEYPVFKVSDMNNAGNETFMETANNYISEPLRKQLGATAFPAESIVFAKVGAAVFLERKKILSRASCLDNNMAAFAMDASRAHFRFIHYVMLSMKLGSLVSTTALPSLSGRVLASIELHLPSLPEQTAIAGVLSDMDAELSALEAQRNKTRDVKQAMIQELLTGKTRLVSTGGAYA